MSDAVEVPHPSAFTSGESPDPNPRVFHFVTVLTGKLSVLILSHTLQASSVTSPRQQVQQIRAKSTSETGYFSVILNQHSYLLNIFYLNVFPLKLFCLKYSTDVSPASAPPGCKGVRGTRPNNYSITTRNAAICKFHMKCINTFTDTTITLLRFHIFLMVTEVTNTFTARGR